VHANVKWSAVALPQDTGQRAPERLAARTIEIPDPGDLVDLLPEPAGVARVPPRGGPARRGGAGPGPPPPAGDQVTPAATWLRELFDGAEIDDQVAEPGSGPVAFGSFTFDSASDGSVLVVPETIIGRRGGRSWLTTIRPLAAAPAPAPARGMLGGPGQVAALS